MGHGFGFACRGVAGVAVCRSDGVRASRASQRCSTCPAPCAVPGVALSRLCAACALPSALQAASYCNRRSAYGSSPQPLLNNFIWQQARLTTLAVQHNAHCCAAPLHSLHCAAVLHCKRWKNSPRASTSSYTNHAPSKTRNASAPPAPRRRQDVSAKTTAATARPRKGGRGSYI